MEFKEKKKRYQVMLYPSLRKKLRKLAFDREKSISAILGEAATLGIGILSDSKPPKPAA